MNEPMSMLQRFVEVFQHWELIEEASNIQDSAVRLAYVTAFMYTHLPAVYRRLKKPFNPLLGETFEYCDENAGFRLIVEQVSHHPPISAIYMEAPSFIAYGDTNLKSSFTRSGLEVIPLSWWHFEIKKTGDHFVIHKFKTKIKNVLFGTMYASNCGDLTVKNLKTGETASAQLAEVAPEDKKYSFVDATIKDSSGIPKVKLLGDWREYISYQIIETGEIKQIFKPKPLLPDSPKMYYFGEFALQLNYLNEEMAVRACPTDSRFRPDQRAMEHGNLSVATSEKLRLEEKQRAKRKEHDARGTHFVPRWFKESLDPETGLPKFEYKGGYWEMRSTGKWSSDIQDIY